MMKLLNSYYISEVIYWECEKGNDNPTNRKLIVSPFWAFMYCYKINDIKEMRDKINETLAAYYYCKFVKDRPEIRKYIR